MTQIPLSRCKVLWDHSNGDFVLWEYGQRESAEVRKLPYSAGACQSRWKIMSDEERIEFIYGVVERCFAAGLTADRAEVQLKKLEDWQE